MNPKLRQINLRTPPKAVEIVFKSDSAHPFLRFVRLSYGLCLLLQLPSGAFCDRFSLLWHKQAKAAAEAAKFLICVKASRLSARRVRKQRDEGEREIEGKYLSETVAKQAWNCVIFVYLTDKQTRTRFADNFWQALSGLKCLKTFAKK